MSGVPAGEPAQRRDRERDADEPERPDAGFVGEIAERIGAEVAGERRPDQPDERARATPTKTSGLRTEANDAIRDSQVPSLS